jgi:3',5'-nucleoside bisphosphate phosphatase
MRVDLHTHSRASDGSMEPSELVRYAASKGLAAIALTDHDTVKGLPEALEEGERVGIEVISGIEISAEYKCELHILGYFFDEDYIDMEAVLNTLMENRNERNPKIISKLNALGCDITMDEVVAEANGSVIGRPHISKVMIRKGFVKSTEEAFSKYLAYGKSAYVSKDKLTPKQSFDAILKAGGIPVLAHPVHLNMSFDELDTILAEFKGYGLKGIEAYYVDNKGDDTGNLLRLAIKHGLIATGGSDFHGSFKPDIDVGTGRGNLEVPYKALEELKRFRSLSGRGSVFQV